MVTQPRPFAVGDQVELVDRRPGESVARGPAASTRPATARRGGGAMEVSELMEMTAAGAVAPLAGWERRSRVSRGHGAGESPPSPAGKRACGAPTKRGTPCAAFALPGRPHCISHDPERAEALAAARSRGGRNCARVRVLQGKRARLDTPAALVRFLAGVIHDVAEGKTSADVGRCLFYGLNVQRALLESSALEQRIAALEAQAPARGRRRW